MEKKDWFTITIGALAILITMITGLVTLESRVSKLEAEVAEYHRGKGRIFDIMEENLRELNHLKGMISGASE